MPTSGLLCPMVATLLALSAVQLPDLIRDLSPGLRRAYRISIVQAGGDQFHYRLETKVASIKPVGDKKPESQLEIRLRDYRSSHEGREVKSRSLGGGTLPFGPGGLPVGFDITGPQGPLWLPMLAFYFPGGKEGESSVPVLNVGGGLNATGRTTTRRTVKSLNVELTLAFSREGKELSKVTQTVECDSQGWPRKGEGTLTSLDGTYRWTVEHA